MRLEEWQKFIESQFLEDSAAKEPDAEIGAETAAGAAATKSADTAAAQPPLEMKAENAETPAVAAQAAFPYAPVTVKPAADAVSHEARPLYAPLNAEEITALTLPFTDEVPLIPVGAAQAEPIAEIRAENSVEIPAFAQRETLEFDAEIPEFASYLPSHRTGKSESSAASVSAPLAEIEPKTPQDLLAPRPVVVHENRMPETPSHDAPTHTIRKPQVRARHARNARPENVASGLAAASMWADVPRHVQTLLALERIEEKEIAQSSYKRPFAEGRLELIERLLDPILSLEDTARLLNVCPTTVRRYTNRGILTHYRKETERSGAPTRPTERETRQRRFRLSDILAFLETQQAAPVADPNMETLSRR